MDNIIKQLEKENAKLKQDIEAYKQSEQEATEIIAELKEEVKQLHNGRNHEELYTLFGKPIKYWEELKAENERLKFKLDTVEADYEASEIEIEDLKNELNLQTTANNHLLKLYEYGQKEVATYKQLADKYLGCLQEIKKIANYWQNRWWNDIDERQGFDEILDLITKAEEE